MTKSLPRILLIYLLFGILLFILIDSSLLPLIDFKSVTAQNIFRYSVFLLISITLLYLLLKNNAVYAGIRKRKSLTQKKIDEQRLRLFFDYINDAAYVYELGPNDDPGHFIEVNQKMVEQLGYSMEELLNMHPYDILAPGTKDIMKKTESQLIKNKHHYLEIDYKNNIGKKFPVEVSLHLFETDGIRLVFGTVKDIREQKKYIRKLRKAKEKAEESDRLKSAFLANLSHEIRTPMNGIIGFSDLFLQEDLDYEQKVNYSKLIKKSTGQLLSIVNDILDISRIETEQLTLIETDCSLNTIMDDVYTMLKNDISKRTNKLEINYSKYFSDAEDTIIADQFRLKQVLSNLLNNAAKFTFKGTIEFGYTLNNKSTLDFFVKDTGIGIPEDKLSLVFERFRQADDSNTREFGGTGLGLPIARGIIEQMKGVIHMDSVMGSGTNVYFSIPYFKSESGVVKEENQVPVESKDFSNKTILIVEDNLENSLLLEEISKPFKINIVKAFSGSEAISYIYQNNNIHLIFMDIRLPDMSGLDVVTTIKELTSLPVVAQTAYASAEDKIKCMVAGCSDYISKPLNREEVERILIKYLS